jgi:hypothetical protein
MHHRRKHSLSVRYKLYTFGVSHREANLDTPLRYLKYDHFQAGHTENATAGPCTTDFRMGSHTKYGLSYKL